ncbi:MAG: peptidylprolyl isomerase [Phycisphaerales bacterium]|nr:peptidylprolyl isomerase [Phycisphaerales bacterium]
MASAQVAPVHEFNGAGRRLLVRVDAPEADGPLTIELHDAWYRAAGSPEPDDPRALAPIAIASAPVDVGLVDLAAVFPALWEGEKGRHRTLYAQLKRGNEGVGPAMVLVPMIEPRLAMLVDRSTEDLRPTTGGGSSQVMYADERDAALARQRGEAPPERQEWFTGYRAWVDQHAVIRTSLGEIELRLRPDQAPNTVRNFMSLAAGGFYRETIFHRVVGRLPNGASFVIQGGDPSGTGEGTPGYNFDLEASALPHDFGVISMARNPDPNTNGCQFFICLSREGTARLDGLYTSFGEAVRGAEVIAAIGAVEVSGANHRPIEPPVIEDVVLIDAPPLGQGPAPVRAPEPAPTER